MSRLDRSMQALALVATAVLLVNLGFHVYWFFGCKYTFGAVLTLNLITVALNFPAAFVLSIPLQRVEGRKFRHVLLTLMDLVPAPLRALIVFTTVYSFVLVVVFFPSLVDARHIGNHYYIYPVQGERFEITAEQYCTIQREDACSSSAILVLLSLTALSFYRFIYPRMADRPDTAVDDNSARAVEISMQSTDISLPSMELTYKELSQMEAMPIG